MLVLAVTYTHNTVEVGGTHAQTCVYVHVCVKGGGGCATNRDLPTSSLSKWHHRRELRLHSCLMAGDIEAHAWTHRSSKRMRRSLLPLLVPRKNNGSPPQVHTCTPGMSRMSGDGNEKGGKKSIWFHASRTRSLTDCDLPLLRYRKEAARPRCHKTAQSGC